MNFNIEALENVVAAGKGSTAYNIGYYAGKVVQAVCIIGGFIVLLV